MNEIYYLTLTSLAAVIIVLMVIDPNVGTWIDLQYKLFNIEVKKRWYILTLGFVLKFQTWKMMRELQKIRKEKNLPDKNHGNV